MFYRFDALSYIGLIFVFWAALAPFLVIGYTSDKININIENDYLDEYNQCKSDLERTQPICPACNCKTSFWSQFFPFIFGLAFGLLIQEWWIQKQKKRTVGRKK